MNRRYQNTHPSLYPTVSAMKNLLIENHKKRGVLLYLDLHGHSKKKNAFLYGSDGTLKIEKTDRNNDKSNGKNNIDTSELNEEIIMKKIYSRTFAKVLCTVSDSNNGGYFSYQDSSFQIESSKKGTGNIVA